MKKFRLILLISLALTLVIYAFLHNSKRRKAVPAQAIVETIRAENCKAEINVEPSDKFVIRAGSPQQLKLRVTLKNLGAQVWGFDGVPMKLGALSFESGNHDANHNPNKHEQWFDIPAPINPGEKIKFVINVDLIPGEIKIWLSPLQPGVMWCYHVGDKPKEINVSVKN